jgi:hypothetical protein
LCLRFIVPCCVACVASQGRCGQVGQGACDRQG